MPFSVLYSPRFQSIINRYSAFVRAPPPGIGGQLMGYGKMLKGQNIICISSIDWDFVWQGHQEIMSAFSRNGNRVLFIENTGVRAPKFKDIKRLKRRITNWLKSTKGFRKEAENLYVYSPLILPFPHSRLARWINRRFLVTLLSSWCEVMDFHSPVIWTFLPTGTALDIINNFDAKLLVYYCIADFSELADAPLKIAKTEEELIKKCDLVFVQGQVLYDKCKRFNDNVHVFPFGVNIEVFEGFKYCPDRIPGDVRDIGKPVIGYIGGVHKHIDFGLLRFIASRRPEWSFVFVGPVQADTAELNGLPNVFFLGKKSFEELPAYVHEFDVGLIPYKNTGYTATVYPTKLNEYHALGKPVVSTDLPEVVNFNAVNGNLVLIASSPEEFTLKIDAALKDKDSALFDKRVLSARQNDWSRRMSAMSGLMMEALEKESCEPVDWQAKLLRLYRGSRKKAVSLLIVFGFVYALLFYTPLVWLLASPLKISQPPVPADCVVVFAGGVGESGKAGQGYEERVEYAVELYRKGYAKNLIFSSGYMYIFKEPLIMKALAVSLGVPENAIITEEKAARTLENVKNTSDILNEHKWKKILLVSSPYHMLRVSLVFKHYAGDIDVVYTPIPHSSFYDFEGVTGGLFKKRAAIPQIKGILHEYLAILFYRLKGYI